MKTVSIGLLFAAAIGPLGCRSETYRCPVEGHVAYEGRPVENGEISFLPLDPNLAPDAGKIENGRFHVEVKPGRKTISIRASRPMPPDPTSGDIFYEDYIPAQFNTESTLSAEIPESGDPDLNFDLAPTPAKP